MEKFKEECREKLKNLEEIITKDNKEELIDFLKELNIQGFYYIREDIEEKEGEATKNVKDLVEKHEDLSKRVNDLGLVNGINFNNLIFDSLEKLKINPKNKIAKMF